MRVFLVLILTLIFSGISFADTVSGGLSFITRVNTHAQDGYSAIWGYTASDGREYALLGVQTGTSIVDLSDPSFKEVAFIPGPRSQWRELKTYKDKAYVVTDSVDSGIQIIDLSGLPTRATLVATYGDLPKNHTLWIDEAKAILYTMGGSGDTVVILSLADPLKPVEISRFGSTYVHDAIFENGRAILSEIMSKSFSIWDISDLRKPVFLKRVRDPAAPAVSFHNSALTADGNYLFTTEETSGRTVKVWDLRDVNAIAKVSEYLPSNRLAHNIHRKGHHMFISSYGGGVRVLDASDPMKPVEVGTWSRKDGLESGFVSVWGVFPYFASGKVIASDMQDGLIVLQFTGR